jgi:hypothetical protein
MSKKKPAKTKGGEWLYLSMAAFNGSGYADRSSADDFLRSYKLYKLWKKDLYAVELTRAIPEVALRYADHLVMMCQPPSHVASAKQMAKFVRFKADIASQMVL